MKIYKYLKFVFLALYIFGIGYSFFASLQDAGQSSQTSQNVTEVVYDVIVDVDPDTNIQYDDLHLFIRKAIGHFSVFVFIGVTGILTYFFFGLSLIKSVIIQASAGIVTAVTSELLQTVSDGRSCSIKDMLIDYSGCVLGIILTFLIIYLVLRKKNHEKQIA